MEDSVRLISFSNPDIQIVEYSGWNSERKFVPTLTLEDLKSGERIIFATYDVVWQLLDTLCFKQPLSRKDFNLVLKHRLSSFEETSLDVIKGVISEADLDKIFIQGFVKEEEFYVQHLYRHYEENLYPALVDIQNLFFSYGAREIFFENFELITRDKNNEYKKLIRTFPSIIGVVKDKNSFTLLHAVELPDRQVGLFNSNYLDEKRYGGYVPTLTYIDEYEKIKSWISGCYDLADEIVETYKKKIVLPEWDDNVSSPTTVGKFKKNYSKIRNAIDYPEQKV